MSKPLSRRSGFFRGNPTLLPSLARLMCTMAATEYLYFLLLRTIRHAKAAKQSCESFTAGVRRRPGNKAKAIGRFGAMWQDKRLSWRLRWGGFGALRC